MPTEQQPMAVSRSSGTRITLSKELVRDLILEHCGKHLPGMPGGAKVLVDYSGAATVTWSEEGVE